jgi:hypothetical protein
MRRIPIAATLLFLAGSVLPAQDVSPQKIANLLKLLSGGSVYCPNPSARNALDGADSKPTWDEGAKLGYATNLVETMRLSAAGKTVVVTDTSLLNKGAAVAITQDGGKISLHFNKANYKGGITDMALKSLQNSK